MDNILDILPKVRGSYRENTELKNWFNISAKAQVMFRPADIEDLQNFLKLCPKEIPINVLGAASNVIIRDEGVAGVVIKLGREFSKISFENNIIRVGSAALCGNVALNAKNKALTNCEFLSGIPGSIGGAVAMNGGCYGSDMSKILVSAKAIDFKGEIIEITNHDFGFFYRGSKIAKDYIFVEVLLQCALSDIEEVARKISELNDQREKAQPIRAKTGGSTFKNPEGHKAWELIDGAGCRGMMEGDAQISEKHCNFMINTGNASAQNMIDLGNKVRRMVRDTYGVNLEWEIKIL